MQVSNPVEWYKNEFDSRKLTIFVFYRGAWCPWCAGYLKQINKEILNDIRRQGGEVIAVTSQPAEDAKTAKSNWSLDFETVSDPSNALAAHLGVYITPKSLTAFKDHPVWYPNGLAQPAVIAVDQKGTIVFKWTIIPAEMNLGGASDRPLPAAVWATIQKRLALTLADGGSTLAAATAEGLPLEDWEWLYRNYKAEYDMTAGWLRGEQAAGKLLSAPRPPY